MNLTDLCQEIHNWFETAIYFGDVEIGGGKLLEPSYFLKEGQYYRIKGSVFNDGVWRFGDNDLKDETFNGEIWAMALPPAILALSADIEKWVAKYGDKVNSPYTSESWNGYSYSKSTASGGYTAPTWQSTFATQLNKWRKI